VSWTNELEPGIMKYFGSGINGISPNAIDLFECYMNYTTSDNCLKIFTQGQIDQIHAHIEKWPMP